MHIIGQHIIFDRGKHIGVSGGAEIGQNCGIFFQHFTEPDGDILDAGVTAKQPDGFRDARSIEVEAESGVGACTDGGTGYDRQELQKTDQNDVVALRRSLGVKNIG